METVAQMAEAHNNRVEEVIKQQGAEKAPGTPAPDQGDGGTPASPVTPTITSSKPTEIPSEYTELVESMFAKRLTEHQQTQNPFSSDRVKFLNDLEKNGTPLTPEVIYESLMDYDKFDPNSISHARELWSRRLKIENPGMSDKHIERLIDSKVKGLKEDEGSEERSEAEALMAFEGTAAKRFLTERQAKLKLPALESQEIINKRNQDRIEEQRRLASEDFDKISKDFKGVPYKIDQDEHLVGFTTEQLKRVKEIYVDPAKIIQSFRTSKGFDGEGYFRFIVKGLYADEMRDAAIAQAVQKGQKQAIIEGDNAKPEAVAAGEQKPSAPPLREQMQAQWGGGTSGYNIPIT